MTPQRETPWYRVAFVWLLVALPGVTVVAGFITLALAIGSDDGLVIDDYYRRGKEINRDLTRDRAASARGLNAVFAIDPEQRQMTIVLHAAAPAQIELWLIHATRQGHDHRLVIPRAYDGVYRAPLPMLRDGRYGIQVTAENWRISGSLFAPRDARIALSSTSVR
jgi:hypothetical protein